MNKYILVALVCFLIFPFSGYSQFKENRYSRKAQNKEISKTDDKSSQSSDTTKNQLPEVVKIKKPHSPHKATIYSMVLPGLGQIYNGQWWKVPFVYGGLAATYIAADWNHGMYQDYQGAFIDYNQQLEFEAGNGTEPKTQRWKKVFLQDVADFTDNQKEWFKTTLKNKKDNFKRDRDFMYILFAGVYVLNIIDATVFAHFYDFDISDDLSMKIQPTMQHSNMAGSSVGLNCTIRF